jgi:hypothetical protein
LPTPASSRTTSVPLKLPRTASSSRSISAHSWTRSTKARSGQRSGTPSELRPHDQEADPAV